MARLPTIKKLLVEDVNPPADSEDWVRRLLYPVNSFMTSVYGALDRDLRFEENIDANSKELTFTTDAAYTGGTWTNLQFPRGIKQKANGVMLLQIYNRADPYSPILNATSVMWLDINGVINITYIAGLNNSTEYTARFLVI